MNKHGSRRERNEIKLTAKFEIQIFMQQQQRWWSQKANKKHVRLLKQQKRG